MSSATTQKIYHEEVDFTLYPDPNMFNNFPYSAAQNYNMEAAYAFPGDDGYPTSTGLNTAAMYAEAPQYAAALESPDLRAAPSNYSTASGPSATSSAMGSPHSIHGHAVSLPEWAAHGLGSNPSIVSYDNYSLGNEYSFQPTGMDDFAFEFQSKPNGFVGECQAATPSLPQHGSTSSNCESLSLLSTLVNSPKEMDTPTGRMRNGSASWSMASPATPVSAARSDWRDEVFRSPVSSFSISPTDSRRPSQAFHYSPLCGSVTRTQELRSPISAGSQNSAAEMSPSRVTFHPSPFFTQSSGNFVAPLHSSCRFPLLSIQRVPLDRYIKSLLVATRLICFSLDPSILHPQYTARPTCARQSNEDSVHPPPPYPGSPSLSSHIARSPRPMKQGSQSPYSHASTYPYPPPRRPSIQSYGSQDGNFSSEESKEKGRCSYPECGKVFKDLKAHMLTHQTERPEKCPIQICDYHVKGFARKYDKNRHTLTHYKGTMVCGFCPGSGSAAEKSFNRADVFKRHLTSVHAVEQTPPNSRKKTSGNVNSVKKPSGYAPDATGKCSTCSGTFSNAQDFYEHLDDCVLRIVQQEEPSEAINAARLAEVEQDPDVHQTLRNNALPLTTTTTTTTTTSFLGDEEDEEDEFDDERDDDFTLRSRTRTNKNRNPVNGVQKSRGMTHSKGGVTLNTKGRKKRKDYPSSWGCPISQMKMKKRVLCVFDGPRRLWKDDMMLNTDYEVRMKLQDEKAYVTDLDVQTMRRADAFHHSTAEEKGPWVSDDLTGMDLEKLMEVQRE
ncbi:c2h2 finger domain containing protein [Drepanopeziza brunnea f. sp. 'multigermtubi' MB_m1]|uniref:C2h2 finger domain containing protein n=1 Tax=Marssonina brunnea f. sp. multigermtubi (strain MB_m1) TaxID=1072389 RepID=K1WI81_MARBU|nr:c2h2 finger domain containing protein [Drepanopeziza brunnea f. sp. 'multigermtubi' MB_m1]EKD11912.1 c2h2 finger domain containing protein [Drepanopeziza brunnea f. sp. 'multigermtubi' MB_m1]